jgi:hypothetical protein
MVVLAVQVAVVRVEAVLVVYEPHHLCREIMAVTDLPQVRLVAVVVLAVQGLIVLTLLAV